jgi:phage/plasmid primase-like uncharacterized protein
MRTMIGDVRAQFEAALRARNLVPPKDIVADGGFHRCNARSRNGKGDGSYVIYGDGTVPAGGFQNFQDGLGWQSWRYQPRGRDPTAAEDAEAEKKTEEARKRRDAAVLDGQKRAAGKARRLWDAATPVTAHPYLKRKQIQTNGIRALYGGGVLVVPAKNASGTLCSLQFIDKDGRKRFLKGAGKKGCYYAILGHGSTIYVAEGFATAASINEVTGCTAFVAFDAGNLQPVAKMVREKHPSAEVVICADDDWKTSGNPGLALARRAARAASAKVARPDFGQNRRDGDSDFNDLFTFIGADAVKRSLEAAMTPDELLVQVLKAEPTLVHDDKTAAELAELKQRNRKLFEEVRNAVRGKVRSKVFDEVVGEAQKKESEVKKVKPSVDPAALEKAAGDLVACEDVLRRFGASIEADGLVQETENAKLLYLTLTSRLFEHPVSAVVKGVSSGGKSFTLERVLAYFPESAFFSRTQWSEHGPVSAMRNSSTARLSSTRPSAWKGRTMNSWRISSARC